MEENKKKKTWVIVAIIAAVVAIGLLVYFLFFYKNKNVRDAEAAIKAIGTVTIDSEEDIKTARNLYDDLSNKEQHKVENLDTLLDAEDEYEDLLNQKKAEEVDKLILKIGEVSADSEGAIKDARNAYDDLSKRQRKYVENLEVLEKAEEDYKYLDVKECENLILEIEEASDSPDIALPLAIAAARNAYDALTPSHQERVKNYDNLVAAEKAYDEYVEKKNAAKIAEEKQERAKDIESYLKSCKSIGYEKLLNNPDDYEGQDISIKVTVVSKEEAALFKKEVIIARPSLAKKDSKVSLVDKRSVKEPEIAVGDTITVFGEYDGLNKDGIPEIIVKYTSQDSEEAINSKPTSTEIFNYIEKGIDIAKGLSDILKSLPWKQ